MTTANKITVLRILLVPVFVIQIAVYAHTGHPSYRLGALLAFAVAGLADGLDGFVARHFNQRTELGAVLDPLADKLLLTAAMITLTFDLHCSLARIPLWLTITALGRDVIILVGMILIKRVMGKVQVRARLTGKAATVLQIGIVLWILLGWNSAPLLYLEVAAAICTAASGVSYILDGVRQVYFHPAE